MFQDYFDEDDEEDDEEKEKVIKNKTTSTLSSMHIVFAMSAKEKRNVTQCCGPCIDVVTDASTAQGYGQYC